MIEEHSAAEDGSSSREHPTCSFCGKDSHDGGPMVHGPKQVFICYTCARLCATLMDEEYRRRGIPLPEFSQCAHEDASEQFRSVAAEVSQRSETHKTTMEKLQSLLTEILQLSKTESTRDEFYAAFLPRVVAALAAVSGAVWICSTDGQLVLKHHVNILGAGLGDCEENQSQHRELLQKVLANGRGMIVTAHSTKWLVVA
jgi:hypothetical protein